jgi:trehalose/maltose transport system substrate-binding protein
VGSDKRYTELLDAAMTGRMDRRQVLRRAMMLGLSLPAIGALLAACGGGSDKATNTPSGAAAGGTSTTGTGATTSPATTSSPVATKAGSATTGSPATGSPTKGSPTMGSPTTGSPTAGGAYKYTADKAPDVANADAAKKYSGTKLVFWGDSVGPGKIAGDLLCAKFTEQTGVEVQDVERPQSSDESYAQYQRIFQAQSGDFDAGMIDVIWPGAFAQHLLDLTDAFSDVKSRYYDTIIQNNTVDGKLIAIPWFGDFGMMYYRTDLAEKYGYNGPPETWDDLEKMAQKVLDGEKAANANFAGFVFQGNAYEGLTCNALEWLASTGGGQIVENGEVTLDNQQAIDTLNRAKGWIGGISPQGVTTYQEDPSLNAFQGGNSMFMRNWPYAYAASGKAGSPVAGKFDVAPIPASTGSDHVGTVGGWQIAVNKYSKNQEAAIEFTRYMTSADVLKWRAIYYSFVPTMAEVSDDPQVVEAMPFLQSMSDVVRVTRPSKEAGDQYNRLSTIFFQGCNEILNGKDAKDVVPGMADDIKKIIS